jgi:hypothetical protein
MQEISDFKEISDTSYLLLYTICPLQIVPALELIDRQCIRKYQCKDSKRICYQVLDIDPDPLSILTSRKRPRNPTQISKNGQNSCTSPNEELKILENSDF